MPQKQTEEEKKGDGNSPQKPEKSIESIPTAYIDTSTGAIRLPCYQPILFANS